MAYPSPRQLQLRRGNTAAVSAYVGLAGEITINTDDWSIRVYDGTTVGGHLATVNTASITGNISSILNGTAVFGNLIPSANVTYSLGNVTHQWNDLFVSNNTIYVGGVPLSIDNTGNLTINGNVIPTVAYVNAEVANVTVDLSSYALNANVTAANVGMQGYVNAQVANVTVDLSSYALNANVTAANVGLKGYVDQANTIQSAQITAANVGMKGYVDNINTTLSANSYQQQAQIGNLQASAYSNSNVASFLVSHTDQIIGGNLTIQGNLTVNGNVTYISVNNVIIGDNIINLADLNPADSLDLGFVAHRTPSGQPLQHTGLVRDASANQWRLFSNVVPAPGATVDFTDAIYDDLQLGNITSPTIDSLTLANTIQTQQIAAANIGIIGYIDQGNTIQSAAITTANVGMKGYVDSQISAGSYGNAQVATYLQFGNIANVSVAGNVTATRFRGNGALLTGIMPVTTNTSANYNIVMATGSNASLVTGSGNGGTAATLNPYTGQMSISGLTIGGYGVSALTGFDYVVTLNGRALTFTQTGNLIIPGNVYANSATITGNVTANYFIGNGALLTGIVAGSNYSNVQVAAYLSTATINTTGNITAQYISGNISITGNVTGTSPNVTIQAGAYTSVFDNQGNVTLPSAYVTGNVAANYFVGNGALLTGIVAGSNYSNINVATYLPTYSGNVANLTVTNTLTLTATKIALGYLSGLGGAGQGTNSVAVGSYSGYNTQGNSAVAIGVNAGMTQGDDTVAIGSNAGGGQTTQAVAVGFGAGQSSQSLGAVALGYASGQSAQGLRAVAIGSVAGNDHQGAQSIAIGHNAGYSNQPANSIEFNATGTALDYTNLTAGLYITSVKQDTANVTNVVYYNTTTKEVTYGPASGGGSYSNVQVATYLPTYTGTVGASLVNSTGNILTTGLSVFGNTRIGITGAVSGQFHTVVGNITQTSSGGAVYINTTGNVLAAAVVAGAVTSTGTVAVNAATGITTNQTTFLLANATATTINMGGAATTIRMGTITSNVFVGGTLGNASKELILRAQGTWNIATSIDSNGGFNSPPYTNQLVIGGSGTGMTANYNATGGYLTSVTIYNPGTGYQSGDVISVPGGLAGNSFVLTNYSSTRTGNSAATYTFSIDGNLTVPGNVTARNFIGSGALLTSLPGYAYSNVNVTAYTESMGYTNYSNVNVAAFTSGLTNYSNVNLIAYLSSVQSLHANIKLAPSGNIVFADGTVQTTAAFGGGSNYGNANVAAYLPTYTGTTGITQVGTLATLNVTGNTTVGNLIGTEANTRIIANVYTTTFDIYGNVTFPGNVIAPYFVGDGSRLTGIVSGGGSSYGNSNVAQYLPTYSGNIANIRLGSSGVLTFADGTTQITAGGGSYSNVQVATYLPTYSGNIGGNIGIPGTLTVYSANSQPFTTNDALYVYGGVTAGGNISSGGRLVACSFAKSTSINSGAIQTNGGIGAWGNLYIGESAFIAGNAIVGVTGYTVLPTILAQFTGNANTYTQLNIQNISTGSDATAEYVATANNGTDTTFFVDMGIANSNYDVNSPNNSLGTTIFPNDSYLYAQGNLATTTGGNLAIGTSTAGKSVKIFAGGINSANIVATVSNTGVAVTGSVSATANVSAVNMTASGNVNVTGYVVTAGGYGNISQVDYITANNVVATANVTVQGIGVTMPNRPAFRVNGTSLYAGAQSTANVNLKGVAVSTQYNQGNYFDATTGKFTAPIAGIYEVLLNARVNSSFNGLAQLVVLKNGLNTSGNVVAFWETTSNTAGATHFGVSGTVVLATGDYLSANILSGNVTFDNNDNWSVTYLG